MSVVGSLHRESSVTAKRPVQTRISSSPKWKPLALHTVVGLIRGGDLLIMIVAGIIASIAMPRFGFRFPLGIELILTSTAMTAACAAFHTLKTYQPKPRVLLSGDLVRRGTGFLVGATAAMAYAALMPVANHAVLGWPLVWLTSCFILAAPGHALLVSKAASWLASGRFAQRIAVVGLNEYSAEFLRRLKEGEVPFEITGLYYDEEDTVVREYVGYPVRGPVQDIVTCGQHDRIDAVVLAMPLSQLERINRARTALRTIVADVYLTAGMAGLYFPAPHIQDLATNPVINISPSPLAPHQILCKAVFDRLLAAVLLVALLPFMVVIVLLIKATSRGPVLFSQPRLGLNNTMFRIYKFRTMYHADADLLADRQTTRGDPRVTPLGRILRKFSLDETPQLINVLAGHMSLVGPRPHAPNTKAGNQLFQEAVDDYALRHRVKPGITGWAQVNGWRGETRTVEQLRQRVAHDLYYIENWSLRFDIRIVLLTLRKEITSNNAF